MRKLSIAAMTAIAALVFATVAFATNTYTVGGSSKPAGKGSKSSPIPIQLKFNFGVGNSNAAQRGSPIKTYAIGSEGLITYPKLFPTCTFSQANGETVASACKKAKVGGGLVQALVGAANDLSLENTLYCNLKLNLYNISGAGKLGGMAIRLDTDPPPPTDPNSRSIGCPTPLHQSIKAKFVKVKISGVAASELRFTVPSEVLHPVNLDTVVRNNESTINKRVAKKKVNGHKVGFYTKIGCKGPKRTIKATFTSEDGVKKSATKEVKC